MIAWLGIVAFITATLLRIAAPSFLPSLASYLEQYLPKVYREDPA